MMPPLGEAAPRRVGAGATPFLDPRRSAVAGIIGNAMEWYDFTIYGYFAPIIGTHFFPAQDATVSLIAAFAVFAAGFFMRPVGGLVFGHIGDRFGRKVALTLSVIAMAVPTCLIGLLPDYQQAGLSATVLIIALRLAQGLSVGGEYTTSIAFLVENAPADRRGRAGSWAPAGGTMGTLLGSAVAAAVTLALSADQVAAWGWRVPFILGFPLGLAGLYVRRRLPALAEHGEEPARLPVVDALRSARGAMLSVFGMSMMLGAGFYLTFVYSVSFVQSAMHVGADRALDINTVNILVFLLTTLASGAVSDRIGRRPLLVGASLTMLAAAYPLFWLMTRPSAAAIFAGQMGFALLLGTFLGPFPATMAEAFPERLRCSGMSIAYNLAQALFGGTTPMVATYLIARSRDDLSPAFYLMAMAAISFVTALGWRETAPAKSAAAARLAALR